MRLLDFDQACEVFANWEGRFEQLSRGEFEATLQIVRGGLIRVVGVQANQRVLLRGHDAAGVFSVYPVTTANAASVWQGHRLTPGHLVVNGIHAEVDHVSGRRSEDVGLTLRPESLEEAARVLLATDSVVLPQTWAAFSPSPDGFANLNRQISHLLGRAVADPSLLGTPECERLEQECVRSLVSALFSTAAPQSEPPLSVRSHMLRRAEEYMRSRMAEPVGAIDLCRELGVSDRTLRLAFRERYGLGPLAFFKKIRLNAVRSRLKADSGTRIAEVARGFGFHHLGNFAADYRRLFGELPSATRGG